MSSQLEMWAEELQHSELTRDMQQAEQLLSLHNESVTQMQNTTYQVIYFSLLFKTLSLL